MKRFRIRAGAFLLAGILPAALSLTGAEEDARANSAAYQQKAVEAYQRKDWPGFLENARKAEESLPGHPRLTASCD